MILKSEEDPIIATLQHICLFLILLTSYSPCPGKHFSEYQCSTLGNLLLEKAKKLAHSLQSGETSKRLASPSEYDRVQPKRLKEDSDATIVFKGSRAKNIVSTSSSSLHVTLHEFLLLVGYLWTVREKPCWLIVLVWCCMGTTMFPWCSPCYSQTFHWVKAGVSITTCFFTNQILLKTIPFFTQD